MAGKVLFSLAPLLPTQPSFLDWVMRLLRLEAELLRLLEDVDSSGPCGTVIGLLGLRLGRLLVVEEIGIRGGGMLSWLG